MSNSLKKVWKDTYHTSASFQCLQIDQGQDQKKQCHAWGSRSAEKSLQDPWRRLRRQQAAVTKSSSLWLQGFEEYSTYMWAVATLSNCSQSVMQKAFQCANINSYRKSKGKSSMSFGGFHVIIPVVRWSCLLANEYMHIFRWTFNHRWKDQ